MTTERRIRALEDRAAPAAEPAQFAMFDHDGRPLNDLAGRMTPDERAAARPFTITIDRANHDADEEAEQ